MLVILTNLINEKKSDYEERELQCHLTIDYLYFYYEIMLIEIFIEIMNMQGLQGLRPILFVNLNL